MNLFLVCTDGWIETNCNTGALTPSLNLPCNGVIQDNTAGGTNSVSGYCQCTFGTANVIATCSPTAADFQFQTCNDACGFESIPSTVMENIIRTVDDAMDDTNTENICKLLSIELQGDPNQNLLIEIVITLKICISDPMLIKPKCIWEAYVDF